jgi:hypothetical protein
MRRSFQCRAQGAPAGPLQPLPVPHHLWSHIFLGSPPAILTVVDQFWTPSGHGIRPGSSVLDLVLEGVLHTHWVVGQPVLRVPPQSNGQLERANQDLETTICCLVSANPTT